MAEREAEKLLSSLGLHRADISQCNASAWHQHSTWPVGQQPGHSRHGTGVSETARRANPAVPFPDHPSPLCARLSAEAHHLPLCTDVGPWTQDHQKSQLSCQVQEGFYIPVPSEVINSWQCLMVVPGDVAGVRGEISTQGPRTHQHNREPSHLCFWKLACSLSTTTQAGLELAHTHACVWLG